jgi:hypothetical protein
VLIMDRSPAGLHCADSLIASWTPADERLSRWRASSDAFFVFFLEQQEGGRAGSMTAKGLDDLLSDVLPTLYQRLLAPPAIPSFGVAADAAPRIWEELERLKAVAAAP